MKRMLTVLVILSILIYSVFAVPIPNVLTFSDITSSMASATAPPFAAQALTTATTLATCAGGGGVTKTVDDTGATWDTSPGATTVVATVPFATDSNPPVFNNFRIKWANCVSTSNTDLVAVCDSAFQCRKISIDNTNKRFMLGCDTTEKAYFGIGNTDDGVVDVWFQFGETYASRAEGGIRGVKIVSNTVACALSEDDNNQITSCVNPNAGTVTCTDGFGAAGIDLDTPSEGQCFDADASNMISCATDTTNTRVFMGARSTACVFGDALTLAGTFAGTEEGKAAKIRTDGGSGLVAGHFRDATNREPFIAAFSALPELDTTDGITCILTEAASNKDSTVNALETSTNTVVAALIANDGTQCGVTAVSDADAGISGAWLAVGEMVSTLAGGTDCNDADKTTLDTVDRMLITGNILTGDNIFITNVNVDAATITDSDAFNGGGSEEANGVVILPVAADAKKAAWGGQTNGQGFIMTGTMQNGDSFAIERTVSLLDFDDASSTEAGQFATVQDPFANNDYQWVASWLGTGGAIEGGAGVSYAGTPEFSPVTLLLAVLLAGGFIVFVVRRRRY